MQPSKLLPFIFIAAWEVPASAQSAASITGEEVIQAVDDVTTLSSELTTVVGSISTATDAFYIGPQVVSGFQNIIHAVTELITAFGQPVPSLPAPGTASSGTVVGTGNLPTSNLSTGSLTPITATTEPTTSFSGAVSTTDTFSFTTFSFNISSPFPSPALLEERAKRQAPGTPQPPVFTDEAVAFAICEIFREFVRVHQVLLSTVIGKHGILSRTSFTRPIGQILATVEAVVDAVAFAIIDSVPVCAQNAENDKSSLDQTLRRSVDTYQT